MDMRTTLELDDDLLAKARHLAQLKGITLGQVITELARKSLPAEAPEKVRNGVRLVQPRPGASRPDLLLVNELRDE
jgi:hypothetical protein